MAWLNSTKFVGSCDFKGFVTYRDFRHLSTLSTVNFIYISLLLVYFIILYRSIIHKKLIAIIIHKHRTRISTYSARFCRRWTTSDARQCSRTLRQRSGVRKHTRSCTPCRRTGCRRRCRPQWARSSWTRMASWTLTNSRCTISTTRTCGPSATARIYRAPRLPPPSVQ